MAIRILKILSKIFAGIVLFCIVVVGGVFVFFEYGSYRLNKKFS